MYRNTVEGGFASQTVDARTLDKSLAFDQERLALALGKALGRPVQALRLPFETFDYAGDRQTIVFSLDEMGWRCTLIDYRCEALVDLSPPRGFGVVRDLTVPADNHPRLSPDGRWEALVEDDNLVVRKALVRPRTTIPRANTQ